MTQSGMNLYVACDRVCILPAPVNCMAPLHLDLSSIVACGACPKQLRYYTQSDAGFNVSVDFGMQSMPYY